MFFFHFIATATKAPSKSLVSHPEGLILGQSHRFVCQDQRKGPMTSTGFDPTKGLHSHLHQLQTKPPRRAVRWNGVPPKKPHLKSQETMPEPIKKTAAASETSKLRSKKRKDLSTPLVHFDSSLDLCIYIYMSVVKYCQHLNGIIEARHERQ